MESIDANKLIAKLQKDIAKSGIVKDKLVKGLKELRPYALEEGDPTLTKVIRLTYEHIEKEGSFEIGIPADEEVEGEEIIVPEVSEGEDGKRESLDYLLSLMLDQKNNTNRQDIFEYRDALKSY